MANDSKTNGRTLSKGNSETLERQSTILSLGNLKLRGEDDDLPQDWWFASTAIPLLAATIGPLANVLSIAALVSKWRVSLANNGDLPDGADSLGVDIDDPHWEIILNALSLTCGFIGNFSLLLNFTRRIRYIVALPLTILFWFAATGLLIATCAAMQIYEPPIRPGETYSQGFWHAIIAAVLYLVGALILMVNMIGYFLGHYPQHFDLDDYQRTLILQTMMFFFWLAGGAAVFAKVCGWSYADALYFCDVTVLTIGFGDFTAPNDVGRGLVFPYAVFGIIFLGLMINSIRKFANSMSSEKVIKKHQLHERERTFGRTVTSEKELRDRLGLPPKDETRRASNARRRSSVGTTNQPRSSLDKYGHFDVHGRTITFHENKSPAQGGGRGGAGRNAKLRPAMSRDEKMKMRAEGRTEHVRRAARRDKLIMLKEERDRFNAMREIQANTNRFKQYYSLGWSIVVFGIVWCGGALVFMLAEKRMQDLSYFQMLYFCYVSLLTIGYGDFSPKSNAGKPFFVIWSLVAIPTMTILISDMSDTIVSAINRGTFTLADWTVMPKAGAWHDFLIHHPQFRAWIEDVGKRLEARKRLKEGFNVQDPDEESGTSNTNTDENADEKATKKLEKLAEEPEQLSEHELARRLALAIKRAAHDLRAPKKIKYSYEEWANFTRLIRFSASNSSEEVAEEEEEEGLLEWDWIGEDSPMLASESESEWVLERLCESLNRYTRKQSALKSKLAAEIALPDKDYEVTANTGSGVHLHSLDYSLSASNSVKRQALHHDHHIDTYPAHPGPRSPLSPGSRLSRELERSSGSYMSNATKSPVLSRNATGDEVVRVLPRGTGHVGGNEGSSEGMGSVVDPVGLSGLLEEAHRRREIGTSSSASRGHMDTTIEAVAGEEGRGDEQEEEAEVSTAKVVSLRHMSSGSS